MIPKDLHFIWVGPLMPDWAKENVDRWAKMHRGFLVYVHGEEILWPYFREAYDRIDKEWNYGREPRHIWSRKSDILRVCALLKYGGWYFDCDCVPLKPLDGLYEQYQNFPQNCFLVPCTTEIKGWIANGVIGTMPDSAFLALIAMGILRRATKPEMLGWGHYGTNLYTALVAQYPSLVQLGNIDDFFPIEDQKVVRPAYQSMVRAGFSEASIRAVFPENRPFILHLGMEDEVNIE